MVFYTTESLAAQDIGVFMLTLLANCLVYTCLCSNNEKLDIGYFNYLSSQLVQPFDLDQS